mmetsp:Transcript_14217/g.28523  ORF Transcript_14217/g.28523 Transcript_14217/m.28523 type:complete len:86 (-) Transcript_14217:477-734(-)
MDGGAMWMDGWPHSKAKEGQKWGSREEAEKRRKRTNEMCLATSTAITNLSRVGSFVADRCITDRPPFRSLSDCLPVFVRLLEGWW